MTQLFLVALLTASALITSTAQIEKKPAGLGNRLTEEVLISYERQSWEAVKRKDYETFDSFLADDFNDIFVNGRVVTKSELQNYIRGVDLTDYSLSGFKVIMLNED